MADRFEQSIRNWYQNSRTANLEFLNLENTEPKLPEVTNNIAVIYDKLLIRSKVSIKNHYLVTDQLSKQAEFLEQRLLKLEATQNRILSSLQTLEEEVLSRQPLTKEDILHLVHEIAQQPTKIEQEALQISAKLEHQQDQLLDLITNLKTAIIG